MQYPVYTDEQDLGEPQIHCKEEQVSYSQSG